MNKKFLVIVLIFLSLGSVYGYDYNENHTDLHLEADGWCANLEINFKVWNATDYENKEEIEDNLCKEGCSEDCDGEEDCYECDDDCVNFHDIEDAEVKVYSGPLNSMPVMFETETNSTGEFVYTFEEPNQYFIEIFPEGRYNDYHELLYLDTCTHAQNTTIKDLNEQIEDEEIPEPSDVEFNYEDKGIIVNLKQTTINDSSMLNVNDDVNVGGSLENMLKIFEIDSEESTDFQEMELIVNLENLEDKEIKLNKYNKNNKKWNVINHENTKSGIKFTTADMGIYAINEEIAEKNDENATQEQINDSATKSDNLTDDNDSGGDDASGNDNDNNNGGTGTDDGDSNESSNIKQIIGIVVALVALIGLVGFFVLKKKSSSSSNSQKTTNTTSVNNNNNNNAQVEHQKEILSTYQQTYQKASDYVNTYKNNYTKDQLYRALESASVPKDIINRVLDEQYE